MEINKIIFWVSTVLFSFSLGSSAVGDLLGAAMFREGLAHLGYPDYVRYFLGTAKLLGTAALLFPFPKQLKEWAYAGFTFNLLGAAYSHFSSGDKINMIASPLLLLFILAGSYFSYHSLQKAKLN
jgi:hypothetical protein